MDENFFPTFHGDGRGGNDRLPFFRDPREDETTHPTIILGAVGPRGPMGHVGPMGPSGPQGPQGPQGQCT